MGNTIVQHIIKCATASSTDNLDAILASIYGG